ncbi:MAG: beta propeller repeat protein, partial [Planctomycetota bacterium]
MGTPAADQAIVTAPGVTYELKIDVTLHSLSGVTVPAHVRVGSTQGGSDLLYGALPSVDSYTFQFVATTSLTWVRPTYTATTGDLRVDNISVKATTAIVAEGKGFNQLLQGMADNHQVAWTDLRALAFIREPSKTPILDDLEREYGIYPNPALSDSDRRDKLAAVKYARVGTGSKDNLQTALRRAGFDNLYVWENSPAQDPNIFFGGALMYCTPSNPLFVSAARSGTGNRAQTSPTGITWTEQTSAADNNWESMAYGGPEGARVFVAVAVTGTNNRVMYSSDGVTWSTADTTGKDNQWRSVTWGGPVGAQLFVAVSDDSAAGANTRVMTSPDGITWTLRTSAAENNWESVEWGGPPGSELFVAVAASGTNNRVMTSPDGITWQTRDTTGKDNNWRDVEWGGAPGAEKFVAIANTSTAGANTRAMTSPDGITWTLQTTPSPELSWQALAWGAGVFTAVGSSGTGTRAMTSPDGITWTHRTTPADNNYFGITYRNNLFVAVSTTGAAGQKAMTSPDGITWTLRTTANANAWHGIISGNVPESIAQCGEPTAQCGKFEGELIVNGDIFDFKIDYLAAAGETLTQCGEPTALAGNLSGTTTTKLEYPIPVDPDDWPMVF